MAIHTLTQNQAAAGAAPWVTINPAKTRTIQVVINGTASVDIEGSNDGINPVVPPLQAGVTTNAGFVDSDPWHYIRANVKSVTGSVTVLVGEA